MSGPYHTDTVYRHHDGVRDPFRWGRFANPRFLMAGTLMVVVLVVVAGQDPRAQVAGEGVGAASHVASQAVRLVAELTSH